MTNFWERNSQKLNRLLSCIILLCLAVFALTILLFASRIEPPADWIYVLIVGLCLEGVSIYFNLLYKFLNAFVDPFVRVEDESFERFRYPRSRRIAMRIIKKRYKIFAVFSFFASLSCFFSGSLLVMIFAVKNL